MQPDFSEFKPRLDRAVREGTRPIIGADSSPEDIRAAFKTHRLLDARDPSSAPEPEHYRLTPEGMRWFVLQTKPGAEKQAAKGLREIGFDPWCPQRKHWRPVRHPKPGRPKKVAVEIPLVTGYLFQSFATGEMAPWLTIEGVDGVSTVLRHNGAPQPIINMHEFEELRRLEAEGHFDETREKPPKTKMGDSVRVTSGPFADFRGVVSMTRGEKVKLMLGALFGSVEISMDMVEVVP